MAVTVISGKDVFLYIGSVLIGCATDVSINVSSEFVDASCKSSAGWNEGKPGMKSWTFSVSGIKRIYTDPDDDTNYSSEQLFAAITAGTLLTIKYGTSTTGHTQYTGTGYLTSWEESAGTDGAATYSAEGTGTGALTTTVVA